MSRPIEETPILKGKDRTIEDVKNSVARNAGLRDWSEVYTKILPTQIDALVNSAIMWSIELYKSQNQKP